MRRILRRTAVFFRRDRCGLIGRRRARCLLSWLQDFAAGCRVSRSVRRASIVRCRRAGARRCQAYRRTGTTAAGEWCGEINRLTWTAATGEWCGKTDRFVQAATGEWRSEIDGFAWTAATGEWCGKIARLSWAATLYRRRVKIERFTRATLAWYHELRQVEWRRRWWWFQRGTAFDCAGWIA